MAVKVTKDNFNDLVMNSTKPVLVDFWATWCGPCSMLSPVIEEFAAENQSLVVAKINVDEEPELARKYNIDAIPSLMLFKGGKISAQSVGYQTKEQLKDMLK